MWRCGPKSATLPVPVALSEGLSEPNCLIWALLISAVTDPNPLVTPLPNSPVFPLLKFVVPC